MICSFNLTFVVDFFQVVVIKNGSETGKLAVIQQKVDDVSNSSMMSMMMWVIYDGHDDDVDADDDNDDDTISLYWTISCHDTSTLSKGSFTYVVAMEVVN